MGSISKIEWTDATWNPITGCSRVSEGCRHCYAERFAHRFSGPGQRYEGLTVLANGHPQWTGAIRFDEKKLLEPLRWKTPRHIFVNSTSDLFHENVTDEQRDRIFAVMALCPQHIFQVLTKRPERMLRYFDVDDLDDRAQAIGIAAGEMLDGNWIWSEGKQFRKAIEHLIATSLGLSDDGESQAEEKLLPLPNVWLGVSVENQAAADERIPLLLQTPAAVRFISAEPLLGPVTFRPRCDSLADKIHAMAHGYASKPMELLGVDWVICGGESGPHARPMHPGWARSLRDQCVAAGVPFFFKQWGEWAPYDALRDGDYTHKSFMFPDGRVLGFNDHNPDGLDFRDWQGIAKPGKKAAGALLDGVEWRQLPEVRR